MLCFKILKSRLYASPENFNFYLKNFAAKNKILATQTLNWQLSLTSSLNILSILFHACIRFIL